MSIRHVKSDPQSKPQRWAFHHGAGRLRAGDATRDGSTTQERLSPVIDAGDGGMVAPDLSGSLAPHRNLQPPPHDYGRPAVGRDALASIRDMRDEDCSGGEGRGGVGGGVLGGWCGEDGWEIVLNRSGTTFRTLPEDERENLTEKKAVALMLAQPSMIKRPVLDTGRKRLVGFKPDLYATILRA